MLTFGYKTKYSSIVRAVAAIGIGIVMLGGADAPTTVVKLIACFLLAAGIISAAFAFLKHRNDGAFSLMLLNAGIDAALAFVLFYNPELIAKFTVFGIGVVLIGLAAIQLIALIGTKAIIGQGSPTMLLSVLALIGGTFLLFSPFGVRVMSTIAGCLLLVYGISELLSFRKVSKAKTAYEIKYSRKSGSDGTGQVRLEEDVDDSGISEAKEVDFHKV